MSGLKDLIAQHLAAAVRSTAVDATPFQHLELTRVFPPDFYAEMLANLPDTRFYGDLQHSDARLPDGRSARRKLELRPARLRHLPPKQCEIWTAVSLALLSEEVGAAYREQFSSILDARFQRPIREMKFHPAAMLLAWGRTDAGFRWRAEFDHVDLLCRPGAGRRISESPQTIQPGSASLNF